MINTYAIDPGVHTCALAAFGAVDKTLFGLIETDVWKWGPIHGDSVIVLEIPRSDAEHPERSNDLIDLNGAGWRLVGQIEAYTEGSSKVVRRMARNSKAGRGWKGQTPKPIHHAQVIKRLTPDELAIVEGLYVPRKRSQDPGTLTDFVASACKHLSVSHDWHSWYKNQIHNPLDAVALGLTHFGRM